MLCELYIVYTCVGPKTLELACIHIMLFLGLQQKTKTKTNKQWVWRKSFKGLNWELANEMGEGQAAL